MIDLDILIRKGITPEALRAKLQGDPKQLVDQGNSSTDDPKLQRERKQLASLCERIRSRVHEGMDRNFREYRVHYAVDQCWETPFRQITPTLVQSFLSSDPNEAEVYKAMSDWGLTSLVNESPDPKTGKPIKTFNYPVFFNVMVPLVRAYVTIRWAKICNDRNVYPFFKYEPIKKTTPLSLKCEALTDRVQVMATQYGYYDVMKQSVLKMLSYGQCLQFAKEEWHSVEQWKVSDELDVELGRATAPGIDIKVTEREGIRYHSPHPTRIFRDLAHPSWTYNYDCGCEFAGYWRICRWREIASNPLFWNTDKVSIGSADLIAGNRLFFTSVYAAGLINMPTRIAPKTPEGPAVAAEVGLGAGALDRERDLANQYYGTDHGDQGVLVTEYFERLVPSENGLGDYDGPVWFRFVVAGDSGTILYAAPLPYCPIVYYGYDEDAARTQNPGLALEVLPFQDHFSNILSQIILTAKQNLANVSFIDIDQIDEATRSKIENMGEQTYRFLNIFGYSSKKVGRMLQNKLPDPVVGHTFPKGNVAELQAVLRQILEVLERVLVMSSQEVAQAASHELRADEVRNIASSTSTRLLFTGTPVDIARDAWKRQLYQGLMAYGDPHIYTMIPSETPLNIDQLTALGFTFRNPGPMSQGARDRYLSAWITKDKTAMDLWQFASVRDGQDRADDVAMAQALSQILQAVLNNPMTAQAIGPDQAIELMNVLCKMVGLPRDLKMRNVTPAVSPEEQQAQAQAQLQQLTQVILQQVQGVVKPLVDADKSLVEENKAQAGQIDAILKIMGIALPNVKPNDTDSASPSTGAGS